MSFVRGLQIGFCPFLYIFCLHFLILLSIHQYTDVLHFIRFLQEGLFEYMLNRVDYEDKAAVELLYDCHTICMKNKAPHKRQKVLFSHLFYSGSTHIRSETPLKIPICRSPAELVYAMYRGMEKS